MKILMTGATGLIGSQIGKLLVEGGHEVFVVSRDAEKAKSLLPFPCEVISGDLNKAPLQDDRLSQIEGVINLMGETISGRWTKEKKQSIYDSRVIGTRNLVASLPNSLEVLVQGSAVGIYGDREDELLAEESEPGRDFLAKVCLDWEAEAQKSHGRKVFIRTGIVLAHQGGAFPQMLFPFRLGIGGPLGNGQQWLSWIHIDDIARMFVTALENSKWVGPINGTAPEPVRNSEFSKKLASQLSKLSLFPVPKAALKVLFAEGADPIVSSQRSLTSATTLGFKFIYPQIDLALKALCEPYQSGEDLLIAEQYFPEPPEKLFSYFKEAKNLENITPPTLSFHIDQVSTSEVQEGTLIDYKLKVHGIPMKWKTEITEWNPPYKFVDNQLKGPYKKWHHTHEFKKLGKGTLMTDRVRYKLPLGYLGFLIAGALVRKDVEGIFKYRRKVISELKF